MLKQIIFILMILFLTCGSVFALTMNQEAQQTLNIGDTLVVTIHVVNEDSQNANVYLRETILNADPIDPQQFEQIEDTNIIAKIPPFYSWNFTLKSKGSKDIIYKIKPKIAGNFYIHKIEGMVENSTEVYYSNDLTIKITSKSGVCEPDLGENYLTDPKDCPTGSKDGLCDFKRDGRCDSDCAKGIDPDCIASLSFWQKIINFFKGLF